ncbi:hypothetical protein [Streptomyces sp. NPDC052107]|uniref:hypothetical protein n=1 Tax=Streptomyces sp. NPDC052107 TaxID=3155632 RepID=UPI00344AFDCF
MRGRRPLRVPPAVFRLPCRAHLERTAFWDTYGPRDASSAGAWRALVYEARHLGAIRLERQRLGNVEGVSESYVSLGKIVTVLA